MGHFSVIGYYWMLLSLCFLYLHKPTYFISSYPICLGIFVVLRQGSLPKNQENNDQFSKTLKIRTIRTTIFSVFMTLKQKSAKMHVIFEFWWCYVGKLHSRSPPSLGKKRNILILNGWKCIQIVYHDWLDKSDKNMRWMMKYRKIQII